MLRSVLTGLARSSRCIVSNTSVVKRLSHGPTETDEEFDARYEAYFSRPDIDGWECRKAVNDLHEMDLVPEPKIIIAALRAMRRLNDYSMTVRFLEAIHDKCGGNMEIWNYVVQEIKPTMTELGINTPDELGYDKPELALKGTRALIE